MASLSRGSVDAQFAGPLAQPQTRGYRLKKFLRRFFRNSAALLGTVLVLLVVISAVFAPVLSPHDPDRQNIARRLDPPELRGDGQSRPHLLGTDQLGRDVLSRIIYGARISLIVGLITVAIAGTIGTVLGLFSGYFGGVVDSFVMRLVDIQLAFPFILLAITIIAVIGSGLTNLVAVMVIAGWVNYARITRGQVLGQKQKEYVEAAKVIGARNGRIMFKHILPNVLSAVIVIGTLQVAFIILAEAGLTFLGLGVDPRIPTWGGMLNQGRMYLSQAWWVATFPGLAIMITVLGANLIGDALRDIFDPRT
jgi:peptide/nickel transport system permease protein